MLQAASTLMPEVVLASTAGADSGTARAEAEPLRSAMLAIALRMMERANMLAAGWYIVSKFQQAELRGNHTWGGYM
jgi:hypothetical protein